VEKKGKIEVSQLAHIGEDIRKAREKRRMTTLEVSEKTRIPERYVRCVEAGDFASLPGKPFIFGFTRTICAQLDLDADAYIPIIRSELFASGTGESSIPKPSRGPAAILRRIGMRRTSRLS
jgi:cytoskeleton protein RodZ